MIKWIKDADTGELFPVPDDFDYEIPEHLKTAECNHIDYEKTTRTTIDELQSRLTAAQNEIAVMQQEKGSTSVAEVTVKEVYPETVSTKRFDFNLMKVIITIVVASIAIVTVVFAFKFASDNNFVIDTSTAKNTESNYELSPIYTPGSVPIYTGDDGAALYINSNSSKSDVSQESEQESQQYTEQEKQNPLLNLILRLVIVILPLFGVRIAFKIIRNVCY